MKKRMLHIPLLLLLAAAVALPFTHPGGAEPTLSTFEAGNKFTAAGFKHSDHMYILDVQQADVTGDQVADNVILLGQKENSGDIWTSQIHVVVQDGKRGTYRRLQEEKVADFNGYGPALTILDFTGDEVPEIMIAVGTGGSGGVIRHLIIDWQDHQKIIFADQNNSGLQVTGNFIDGWQAELTSDKINKTFTVDISSFQQEFAAFEMYDQSGKFIGEMASPMIVSDDFSSLTPLDIDGDGVYELIGNQLVWGPAHVNGITWIESTWKYKEGQWVPIRADYTITKNIFTAD